MNSITDSLLIILNSIQPSQLEQEVPTLEYGVLKKIIFRMLTRNWGTTHTYDHRDTSNMCLLCRAVALWFNLVSKLIEKYTEIGQGLEDAGGDVDIVSPPVETRKSRLSVKELITPKHRRKKAVTLG